MTNLERLKATRALIADESNFTTIVMARDSKGVECASTAPEAARWCVVGAWLRITETYGQAAIISMQKLRELSNNNIFYVNDILGHKAVLNMLDDAIEKERKND
jgi:hypothetical protein